MTAVASALIGRAGRAVASRLKTMLRHDDPGLGYAVFIELEVVHEKVRRVLVVEEVEAWLVDLGGLGRAPVLRRGPAAEGTHARRRKNAHDEKPREERDP